MENRTSSLTCPSTAKPPATYISTTSFNPPHPWEVGIIIPTSKIRTRGSERLSNLLKVTQLVTGTQRGQNSTPQLLL